MSAAALACVLLALAPGCDKVPLLAPTGTVISLFPTATTVPVNGEIEIIATAIEQGVAAAPTTPTPPTNGTPGTPTTPTTPTATGSAGAGTPVQNGTLISFTTTIGTIEPREARTRNGEVRVRFIAGGQSGSATITAYSGGASGKLENLKVGTAATERVIITASPQTLGPSGGTSTVSARVEDVSGRGVAGIPVSFTTSAGDLNPPTATTNADGVASTTLTTTREATVTANVAGKTAELTVGLNPRTGISITGPTQAVAAGLPATFTVQVNGEANVRDVVVNFGDGTQQSLGALTGSTTVQHVYNDDGTYTVTARAVDASGFSEQVSTSVTILPAQPPGVIINVSDSTPTVNQLITLTANVSGATSTILSYQWDFGDGTTATTTGPQITKAYGSPGTKVIRVTVNQAIGPSGQGQTTVDVQP